MRNLMRSRNDEVMEYVVLTQRLLQWYGRTSSPWTEYKQLRDVGGWDEGEGAMSDTEYEIENFRELCEMLDVPIDEVEDHWVLNQAVPAYPYRDNAGKWQQPQKNANYYTLFNKDLDRTMMIITEQFSPESVDKKKLPEPRDPPKLSRWSDVVFLAYRQFWSSQELDAAGTLTTPCPRYIMIDDVINDDALKIFAMIRRDFPQHSVKPPPLPGRRFVPGDLHFRMLLGAPQGRGIALFLLQHKAYFGLKTVTAISYTSRGTKKPFDQYAACLLFEIGDVKPETIIEPGPGEVPLDEGEDVEMSEDWYSSESDDNDIEGGSSPFKRRDSVIEG